MNEKTIIEVKIDEHLERKGQRFYFKFLWKREFNNLRKIILFTIIFLALGFFPLRNFDQNALYYVFRYGGVFGLISILLIVSQYFKSKKKFYENIEKVIKEIKVKNMTKGLILLDDKSIEIQNSINNIGTIWGKTNYILVDDYLIITLMDNLAFVFAKEEFYENDFQTISSFLQKYSTQKDN